MTMKKSLIAAAVAGAVTVPATASAADAYGFIFAGLDTTSADGGGIPNIFTQNFGDQQEELFAGDTPESRFGFKGSEDIGGGLTGSYRFEFGLSTSSVGNGAVNEDTGVITRLSWVALGGDWGQIKGGTMWSIAYEYSGWNVFRSRGHGGAAYYRPFNGGFQGLGDGTFTLFPDNPSGLRQDNTFRYTWGGGGYSSDPFTFSIDARFAGDDRGEGSAGIGETGEQEESLDAISAGAQGTFAENWTVNGFVQTAQADNDTVGGVELREPTIWGLGGRWNNGTTNVGLSIIQTDIDGDASNARNPGAGDVDGDPLSVIVEATHNFGNNWSGMAMFGTVDGDDAIHDMETDIFLQADYAFSARTHFQFEAEFAELDSTSAVAFEDATTDDSGNPEDAEETVVSVGLIHNF